MFVGRFGRNAPLRCTVEESKLEKIRLDDVHNRILLLANGGGDGIQAYRSTAILLDNGLEHAPVDIVETKWIDLQQVQRLFRDFQGNLPIGADLGIVADATQ